MKAAQLLDFLRRVREMQFTARSAGQTGWNGDGDGSVSVEALNDGVVIFHEVGAWRPDGGIELRFSNVYRWSLVATQAVRLEHLRFGSGQPVHLFDLASESEFAWSSISPHHCGDDCYSARLVLHKWGVSLRWAIVGPRKREALDYAYSWPAEG